MSDEVSTAKEGTDYVDLSRRDYLVIFGCSIPLFFVFAWQDQDARGFVAALSLDAVLAVALLLRPHSRQKMYWLTLVVMFVVHALVVILVPWPRSYRGPGIVFAPLVIVDLYVWVKLLLVMVKREVA